ncbi:MAG: rubrerythrin family protein [Candidatus Adiutrix sp.]|jgi:rubrerythrin|nr:rubrerythrin family protein [Candidatus Adiutrix sp.]
MASIKGSQTEKNILTAFAGESQARNIYTFAASVAKKEGQVKISQIYEETANQEKEHGKRLFKFLEGGSATITAAFTAGISGGLAEYLAEAAAGEHHEWTEMYPGFAKTAEEEGFKEAAVVMKNIATAERYHENRFKHYLNELKTGASFKRDAPVVWRCLNCGFTLEAQAAPAKCPACEHPVAYFEPLFEVVKP